MKIMAMSDIHGDFETFDKALKVVKQSDADVLTISGDILGSMLNEEETESFMKKLYLMRNLGEQVYHQTNGKINTFKEFKKFLKSDNLELPYDVKSDVEKYLQFEESIKERQILQYNEFKERFNDLEKKIVLVPGNWDGSCIDSVLHKENIHNKGSKNINGIEIVGYGGSNLMPQGLSEDAMTEFDGDEAFSHFSNYEDAEVILTHECPRGFEGNGYFKGEYSLLANIYKNTPSLVLCGHTHSPLIAEEKKSGTIIANPGNLGRYNGGNFGTFLEINIDENAFVKPETFYQLNGNDVKMQKL
ncbi:MAG: metallophosphoesterase family protein [Nanoarchaeota archaeon]|nr:metallophosphoesterase family protein [Nanoarchaeota archaeon]MBU4117040.1 metallophosphoesterase family protein [Nanoarchaeota archaeon]